MKHDQLCAIGHNLADSLASGLCFVIGYHETRIFREAAASPDGVIEVDFLRGSIVRGEASDNLRAAVARFGEILPEFCRKHGAEISDFMVLSAAFEGPGAKPQVRLTVQDREGRSSTTDYRGYPLSRPRVLDPLGRIRRARRRFGAFDGT